LRFKNGTLGLAVQFSAFEFRLSIDIRQV
jgi:hypothetical protein